MIIESHRFMEPVAFLYQVRHKNNGRHFRACH